MVRSEPKYADIATNWLSFAKAMSAAMDKFRQVEGQVETETRPFANVKSYVEGITQLEFECVIIDPKAGGYAQDVRRAEVCTALAEYLQSGAPDAPHDPFLASFDQFRPWLCPNLLKSCL